MTLREFFSRPGAPTQVEVAKMLNIKQATLNHYVNERRYPPKEEAAKIADGLNEPALYDHWYPRLEVQLERMGQGEERVNG